MKPARFHAFAPAALLVLAVAAAAEEPPAVPTLGAHDDLWSAVTPEIPGVDESPAGDAPAEPAATPLHRSGQRSTAKPASEAAAQSWPRTLGALAVVVGLIVLLTWGYRVATGAATAPLRGGRRPGMIEVVSRTVLSPRQSICLVRVGPRLVLVGVTPERLTSLDVVADSEASARVLGGSTAREEGAEAEGFEALLAGQESQYGAAAGGEAAGAARGVGGSIDRVRAQLGGALARLRQAAGV